MNKKQLLNSIVPHLIAFGVLLVIALVYFAPTLSGKRIVQSDIVQWKGSAQEAIDFRAETGEEPLWTNSMFSGMPAYQINMKTKGNWVNKIRQFIHLHTIPKSAGIILFCMLSFYILMLVLKVHPIMAVVGGIAYGLTTYNMLILEAGHVIKSMAIAYIPLVIAGTLLVYRGKYLVGAALAGLGFAFSIAAMHYQSHLLYAVDSVSVWYCVFGRGSSKKDTSQFYKGFFDSGGSFHIRGCYGFCAHGYNL